MPNVRQNRVATQLLVSRETRDRGRALAVVQCVPVADVWRSMIEGDKLKPYERKVQGALDLLHDCFKHAGIEPETALEIMIKRNLNLDDLINPDGTPKDFSWT